MAGCGDREKMDRLERQLADLSAENLRLQAIDAVSTFATGSSLVPVTVTVTVDDAVAPWLSVMV